MTNRTQEVTPTQKAIDAEEVERGGQSGSTLQEGVEIVPLDMIRVRNDYEVYSHRSERKMDENRAFWTLEGSGVANGVNKVHGVVGQ